MDLVDKVRVGLRLTPENSFNDMSDSDPQGHFNYFVEQLSPRGLAYLHVLEDDMINKTRTVDYRALRVRFAGPYIANNGYDKSRAGMATPTWWRSVCPSWPTRIWCTTSGKTCR